jgi:hypothetical protein
VKTFPSSLQVTSPVQLTQPTPNVTLGHAIAWDSLMVMVVALTIVALLELSWLPKTEPRQGNVSRYRTGESCSAQHEG